MLRAWDPGDKAWFRVYHRDYQTPGPLHRRTFGPRARFDHHRPDGAGRAREDPDGRSVIYLGRTLGVALAEVFWDQPADPTDPGTGPKLGRICPRHYMAQLRPTAKVERLLSLCDGDADAIDALPQLSTGPTEDYPLTQRWALAIYEDLESSGIWYPGAHNLGESIVLWDNAAPLETVKDVGRERDHPLHEPGIWELALDAYSTAKRSLQKITSDECPRCRELGLR